MNNKDFKARIAAIVRGGPVDDREDAELYVLRNRAPLCVLRKPGSRTPSEVMAFGKTKQPRRANSTKRASKKQ